MPKYLFEGRYTVEGTKGLARGGGSARRAAIETMTEGLGGKVESFYFGFGDVDVYAIIDVPDTVSVAAMALAINQAGGATVRTVVLMTPEEVDAASRTSVNYRPPGS